MEFSTLDRDTCTVALVGHFLQCWAAMEAGMNTAIQRALNLTDQQSIIVTTNLALRDKVHILRTAVSVSSMDADRKKKFDKTLLSIARASSTRNMMAHDLFATSKNPKCAVDFYAFRAKGQLNTPVEKWSIAKFEAAYERMHRCDTTMNELIAAFGHDSLVAALLSARNRPGLFWLEGLDSSRANPPINLLDSTPNPATPEKDDENLQLPEDK